MQFNLQPQVTLATAGSNVTFNGTAEHGLYYCTFWLPPANQSVELYFTKALASHNTSLALYHGDGLEHRQCGVTLLDVQPALSGFVRGQVYSERKASANFVQLIVLSKLQP
jgi:hypothetical protein